MAKSYHGYMMTNKFNRVIYTGVTNVLERRVYEHKTKVIKKYTTKYNCKKLVHYAETDDISFAITEEPRRPYCSYRG